MQAGMALALTAFGQSPVEPERIPAVREASPSAIRPAREADSSGNEDPVDVLMRLRDQVLEHGERIPNHTCVESMQRDRYEPVTGRAPKSCDTLLARRRQADFQGRLKLNSTDWLRLTRSRCAGRRFRWAARWSPSRCCRTGGREI